MCHSLYFLCLKKAKGIYAMTIMQKTLSASYKATAYCTAQALYNTLKKAHVQIIMVVSDEHEQRLCWAKYSLLLKCSIEQCLLFGRVRPASSFVFMNIPSLLKYINIMNKMSCSDVAVIGTFPRKEYNFHSLSDL